MAWRETLRFPNPVNEVSARLVATGVLVQAVAFLVTGWWVLLVTLAAGFVLRVLFGPRVQHRGQTVATFPLLFNALWSSVAP